MANESLKRTPTSSGNRRVFTWSGWVKKNVATSSSPQSLLTGGVNGSDRGIIDFDGPGEDIRFGFNNSSTWYITETTSVFRDPSSWKNVVVSVNLVNADVSIYVNGIKQSSSSVSWPSIVNNVFNAAGYGMYIGSTYGQNSQMYNGEMFDVFWVDGQALTPDVFGFFKEGKGYQSSGTTQATDFGPGQWSPHSPRKIKTEIERKGGFGVNGFYLPMNDSSNFGADFHTTPNSIITLKGEDLPQPRNGAPTTSDAYVSQLRQEVGTLGFDGCIKLDGNQGLSIADTADLDLGTGDFTIEGFYYLKDEGTYHALFDFRGNGGDGLYPALFKDITENKLYFYENAGVEIDDISMRHNEWMHVAICRSSGTTRAFVDGKLSGSFSDSNNYISRDLYIGQSMSNSNDLYGFVSNFRIVKGTALYTSNFTVPTAPLENVTNTILLCANSSTSATASTVTPSTISTIGSPIATKNELTGSIVLAVPGISTATGSNLITNGNFDSTDISSWTTTDNTQSWNNGQLQINRTGGGGATSYKTFTTVSGQRYSVSGTVNSSGSRGDINIKDGTGWAGTTLLYLPGTNGEIKNLTGSFTASSTTSSIGIGVDNNGTTVYIDNLVVKQEDAPRDYSADIKGSGTNKTLTPYDNAGVGYEIPSYYGSAMNFDGATDYMATTLSAMGTNDFTIEFWVYPKAISGSYVGPIGLTAATNVKRIELAFQSSSLQIYTDTGSWRDTGFAPPTNQWTHIALEKYNGYLTVYANGVAVWTVTNTRDYDESYNVKIGKHVDTLNGYMQDVRVYNGVAKYKGGFDVSKPYTPVGFEAGSWRQVSDTCKNNFCTMNPLNHNNGTFANGNLTTSEPAANGAQIYATMGSNTGKWYYEAHVEDVGTPNTGGTLIGINPLIRPSSNVQNRTAYRSEGSMYNDSGTDSGSSAYAYVAGDTIGVAWDADNKRLWFAKNGTWLGSGDPAGNSNPNVNYTNTETQGPFIAYDNGTGAQVTHLNFGQNPAFSGTKIAGTYTDSNGKGLFKYQPPTGYLALCEDNLPTPAIADPGEHFKTVLYSGDGNTGHSITGVGFQPDLVWIKERTSTSSHQLHDSVRGAGRLLMSNATNAESYSATYLYSLDSDGFTLGSSGGVNASTDNYAAWCWKAGGAAVSNTDGGVTSQVSVNQTAGFSIIKVDSLPASTTSTFGHGLNKKPDFIIFKSRNNATNWDVYHSSLTPDGERKLYLNGTNAEIDSGFMGDTPPTSSVISFNPGSSNSNHIVYCWTEIEGYSKFGSYLGNGNADGPFVYCGFKPAWVLIKKTDGSGTENWRLFDSSRCPTNQNNIHLLPSSANAESTETGMDFLSNGFKLRHADAHQNQNGTTYIFAAFAESPFQTANAK